MVIKNIHSAAEHVSEAVELLDYVLNEIDSEGIVAIEIGTAIARLTDIQTMLEDVVDD